MKFFPFPEKLKSFCSQCYYKRKVIKPFQVIVGYDYDRDGNVRFTDAWHWDRDLDLFVDDPLGGATRKK